MEIPLKFKYTAAYVIAGRPSYNGVQEKPRKRCKVCGYGAPKKSKRGYIHPKCRMKRKDGIIKVRPRRFGRRSA